MKAAGLITVAGQSLRMQAFKPLLPINETPMIAHTANVFSQAGITDLFVVAGKRGEEVADALEAYHPRILWNTAFATTEMFTSLQIGLGAIRASNAYDAAFVLPGDMPAVHPEVLRTLMREMESSHWDVVFPSTGERRLHPPLIHARLFDRLIDYSGEDGLRGAFRAVEANIGYVITQQNDSMLDVDTPQDYARVQEYMKKTQTREDKA